MTPQERIARDLAAELAPAGVADWRRYLAMARAIEIRLDRQFEAIMGPRSGIGAPPRSRECERQEPSRRLSSEKET